MTGESPASLSNSNTGSQKNLFRSAQSGSKQNTFGGNRSESPLKAGDINIYNMPSVLDSKYH